MYPFMSLTCLRIIALAMSAPLCDRSLPLGLQSLQMCACVRACACVCMCACVRECVRACVHACVRACVLGYVCGWLGGFKFARRCAHVQCLRAAPPWVAHKRREGTHLLLSRPPFQSTLLQNVAASSLLEGAKRRRTAAARCSSPAVSVAGCRGCC